MRTGAACSWRACAFVAPGAPGHARLATLRERLRCVGGASAERTLALALEHLEKRARPESAPPTDGDASEASRSTIRACDVLVDLAWEKLHTGDWKDVDEAWRDLYVMASMAVADARGGFAPARAAETLASLDRASLLGGPTFRDELERAIAHAQEAMESDAFSKKRTRKRRTRLVVRALGDDAEDDVVAALPPGSLGARDAKAVSAKQKQKRETKTSEEDTETNRARRATLIRLASAREPVATFASPPSLERFLTDAMAPGEPAVLKGLAFAWPAFAKWRDPTYLRAVAGARTVPVETGEHYLHATHARELVTLDAFLDEYVFVENARDERDETFEKKALSRSALRNSETSVSDAQCVSRRRVRRRWGTSRSTLCWTRSQS
jgi:lysine-specific demethylase 8